MPPVRSRTWDDVLDNLGENLVRLGTSLSFLADSAVSSAAEGTYAQSMEQIATGFRLAFRQARPALAAGESSFRQLTRASVEEFSTGQSVATSDALGRAHTLVHEGILVCQEMVTLLNLIEQGAQTEPEKTRQTFVSAARRLAEVTATAGWELRTVCHEYDAEVRLSETAAKNSRELVLASMGLLQDMANAAQSLRAARREWYRLGQRLSAVLGADVGRITVTPET